MASTWCSPATSCKTSSAITHLQTSSTHCSRRRRSKPRRPQQENFPMTETTAPTFKPKKSVALSGTAAGNTALCTVGRSGNDLHYRGYDILDVAAQCEFEEIAHLLVHGKLPTVAELAAYKRPEEHTSELQSL